MRKNIAIAALALSSLALASCGKPTAADLQAREGAARANGIQFDGNAELDNIEARLKITANPNTIGFIALFNETGSVVLYTSVRGKVTSSGKRLTDPQDVNGHMRPSDEGTWGSSDPYIYFWTLDGQYMQWNGRYIYSNSPIRLSVEPLVVNIGEPSSDMTPWKVREERAKSAASAPKVEE